MKPDTSITIRGHVFPAWTLTSGGVLADVRLPQLGTEKPTFDLMALAHAIGFGLAIEAARSNPQGFILTWAGAPDERDPDEDEAYKVATA